MYVPSVGTITKALGIERAQIEGGHLKHVSLNVETLRLFLQFIALAADYDEATYLEENPDVAAAYEAGQIADLRLHFVQVGYFEGRRASRLCVDQDWYCSTYPDVANAIREDVIPSAEVHFLSRGEIEWRAPNATSLPWTRAWADALSHPQRPDHAAISP